VDIDESLIHRISSLLTEARSVVVLTGAGISAESGLATFRDPEEGLWAKYDPMELATIDAFNRDPELVTRWYHWRFTKAAEVEPNPGHQSHRVIEIHGTILRWRCTKTGAETPLADLSFETFPIPSEHGGLMRPCVVWFGEMLPEQALSETFHALEHCDLFLSIGTSATVQPAASFIEVARAAGATTVEINRDPTPNTRLVDAAVHGPSGSILPRILNEFRQLADS